MKHKYKKHTNREVNCIELVYGIYGIPKPTEFSDNIHPENYGKEVTFTPANESSL